MASKTFSIESYEREADKLYKSYKIRVDEDTIVTLYNPIRISEENRSRLFEIVPLLDTGEGEFTAEKMKVVAPLVLEILELVGDDNVEKLIARIRNDLSVTMSVFQDYFKEIGLGDPSSSES
jgi:hypothetical protein